MSDKIDTSAEAVERLARVIKAQCGCALGPNAEQPVAGTLVALAAERDRLVAQLAEARAEGWHRGIEAAAREVDCACEIAQKQAVIATTSPNGGPRWMACGAVDCSALTAAAIRALPLPADLGGAP